MSDSRPCKRRRTSVATTPPTMVHDPEGLDMLDRATSVLSVQATALSNVTRLYQTDTIARGGLLDAVDCIVRSQRAGGKILLCGIGKSGLVGAKTVATLKSLSIGATFLHAAEAAHGDLGDIRPNDVVLFISFSGKTPELLNVLPHLSPQTPIIAMTSHMVAQECPLLLKKFDTAILLPTPIHEPEETSFGVCAPTTSTTVTIAIGDMLALTVAEQLHQDDVGRTFRKNHPGGAIGADTLATGGLDKVKSKKTDAFGMVTPLELPAPSILVPSG